MTVFRRNGKIIRAAGGGVMRPVIEPPPNVAPTSVIFSTDTVSADIEAGAVVCWLSSPGAYPAVTYSIVGGADELLFEIDGIALKRSTTGSLTPADTVEVTVRATNAGGTYDAAGSFTVTAPVVVPVGSIVFSTSSVAYDAEEDDVLCTMSAPGATQPATYTIAGGDDAALVYVDGNQIKRSGTGSMTPADELDIDIEGDNAANDPHVQTWAPTVYDPAAALVLFTRKAIGRNAASGTVHTFAQVFARNRVPVGSEFVVRRANDTPLRTQFEPITFYEDGEGDPTHVKFALVAIELPSLATDVEEEFKFVLNATHPSPGTTINLATALSTRNASVTVTPTDSGGTPNGTPYVLDLTTSVPAERRRSGPLVSETRWNVEIPSESFGGQPSGRLVVDAWVTADGAMFVDAWIGNIAFDFPELTATSVFCQMDVVIDGVNVLSKAGEVATLSGVCRFLVGRRSGSAADPDPVYMRANLKEMFDAGLSPWYDENYGVSSSRVSSYQAMLSAGSWQNWTTGGTDNPLRGLVKGNAAGSNMNLYGIPFGDPSAMVLVGGPMNVSWPLMIGQAEGMGASANYVWDRLHGRWLNNVDRPGFQAHGNRSYYRPQGAGGKSFKADGAHWPLCQVLPLIMTGRRGLADNVIAYRYNNSVYGSNEAVDGVRSWGSTTANQIRTLAYSMLEAQGYWFAIPEDEPYTVPGLMDRVLDDVFNFNISRIPMLDALNGEVAGKWQHGTLNRHSFWQDALVVSALALLAKSGFSKAQTLLTWAQKFMLGGWTVEVYGMPGAMFREAFTSSSTLTTWAQLGTYSLLDSNPSSQPDAGYIAEQRMMLAVQAAHEPDNLLLQEACANFDTYALAEPRITPATMKNTAAIGLHHKPRQAQMRPPGYAVPDATGVS